MRVFGDAAWPAAHIDAGLDGFGFYIGGDTPHVWSDAEIAALTSRWRLPIYTCSNPGSRNVYADAMDAVAWLRAHHVPAGAALALDYETAVDGPYLTAFDRLVTEAGWRVLLYGSLSTVTQNPRPSAGYWTASWTGAAHIDPGAAATQWASDTQLGRPYDLSQVSDGLVLWDTKPPAPDPAPSVQEDDMQQIEPLSVHPGEYAYGINTGAGQLKNVAFCCDGYGQTASLRVVVWDLNGLSVHAVTVGGPGPRAAVHQAQVAFPDPGTTYQVTVHRQDQGAFPVGVVLS